MFRLTSLHLSLIAATVTISLSACGGNVPTMETHRRVIGRNSTTMPVYPIGTVTLQSAGVWKEYNHLTTTVLDPTAMTGGLMASTRYWLYAIDDAGVIAFEVSTTGPEEGLLFKMGDNTRWFLSTFSTDAGGNLVAFEQVDEEFTLSTNQPILNSGSETVTAPITFGTMYPPQAHRVYYSAYINASSSGDYADIIEGGYVRTRLKDDGVSGTYAQGFANVSLSGGTLSYRVSSSEVRLTVEPLGFRM